MDDKPLQALANKLKTPAQESQRNGFFRPQQVKKTSPRNTRFRLLSNCSGVSSACSTGCMSDFL